MKLIAANTDSTAPKGQNVLELPNDADPRQVSLAGIERVDGRCALVARTCDESQAARLLLPDTDPQRVQEALDYLTERLTAIGLVVLEDEAELEAVH